MGILVIFNYINLLWKLNISISKKIYITWNLSFLVVGARCVSTLLYEMKRRGKDCRFGVISMCIGDTLASQFMCPYRRLFLKQFISSFHAVSQGRVWGLRLFSSVEMVWINSAMRGRSSPTTSCPRMHSQSCVALSHRWPTIMPISSSESYPSITRNCLEN